MNKINEFTFKDNDPDYLEHVEYLEFKKNVEKVKDISLFKYIHNITFEAWKESKNYYNGQLEYILKHGGI